jgi:hypothetical protein
MTKASTRSSTGGFVDVRPASVVEGKTAVNSATSEGASDPAFVVKVPRESGKASVVYNVGKHLRQLDNWKRNRSMTGYRSNTRS